MPRIFSFRLQCGGEDAPCGRGKGSHGQPAKREPDRLAARGASTLPSAAPDYAAIGL
jgi:hypothetical protein